MTTLIAKYRYAFRPLFLSTEILRKAEPEEHIFYTRKNLTVEYTKIQRCYAHI